MMMNNLRDEGFEIGRVGAAYTDGKLFLAITLLLSVIFGLAAMQFGDNFWRWVGKWL